MSASQTFWVGTTHWVGLWVAFVVRLASLDARLQWHRAARFICRYLNEQGRQSTAIIGKLGPTLIFDHTDRAGASTIVVDDSTGHAEGIPLSPEVTQRLTDRGLPTTAPSRGDNGAAGNATAPGTTSANVTQQSYFADVATNVVLPMFKERGKPFVVHRKGGIGGQASIGTRS